MYDQLVLSVHLSCLWPACLFFTVSINFLHSSQEAFKKAGKPEQSAVMLHKLTHNAVIEHRYVDMNIT